MESEDAWHWRPNAGFLILGRTPPAPARAFRRSPPMIRRIILIPAGLIALVVAVVSFSALTEIEGQWPWRRKPTPMAEP